MSGALRLENRIQPYAWGSKTAIPRLFGRAPSAEPEAELWIGAHPKAPSTVQAKGGRQPLDAWLQADPAHRLGAQVQERFGGLPFLLKYLAAAEPLPIQCHPNRAQAKAGFAREEAAGVPLDARERTYRDKNPKPELIVARARFEALKGFRSPEAIQSLLGALNLPDSKALLAPLTASAGKEGLAMFYRGLMRRPAEAKTRLALAASLAASKLAARNPAFEWVTRLAQAYPGDVGVLSPLLLEYVALERDEALYLGAGELHAYLGGEAIEIMANSDNVVRGGLTQKHVDVGELLDLLTFDSPGLQVLRAEAVGPGLSRYPVPAEDFSLCMMKPRPGQPVPLDSRARPSLLFALNGRTQLSGPQPITLDPGQSLYLPPQDDLQEVTGEGEVAWASVPSTAKT